MMKKAIILPYFGKFNAYFRLWADSCAHNPDIDFLLFTDAEVPVNLPSNIKTTAIRFERLKEKFQAKFDFSIRLDTPYKLCDYKPYYGYLFQEELRDYDFWGYCDCDTIWGQIGQFLPEEYFSAYDKLLRLGHLCFVRNAEAINTNFLKFDTYRMVLTSPAIYGYDEAVGGYHKGFAGELLDSGYRFLQKDEIIADVDFRHYPFHVVTAPEHPCIFEYWNGRLFRLDKVAEQVRRTEMMYFHLQKRAMIVEENVGADHYLILPNRFVNYDEARLKEPQLWQQAFDEKADYFDFSAEKKANRKRDMIRLLHEPHKVKSILYRLGVKNA